MRRIKLSRKDVDMIGENFSSLQYNEKKNTIEGILHFDLKFETNGITIVDDYHIEINLNNIIHDVLPTVRETAGRIADIARKKGLPLIDLHINENGGDICLIIPPKISERYPDGFNLKTFIYHLQEYLYWVSYYEKYDEFPWKGYSHGKLGYIELFIESPRKYWYLLRDILPVLDTPEVYNRALARRIIKKLKGIYKI